jgi:peptidylprolyl isomerase
MKKAFLIVLALSAFALAACGGGDSGTDTSAHSASNPFTIPVKNVPIREEKDLKFKPDGLSGPEPKPIIPDGPPPEFLALQELIEGIGQLAEQGDTVTVQLVGVDYETGKKFISSWDMGKPLTLTLGGGEVSEGLEEGLLGMEVSDRREIVIPPDLAHDPQGKVPPNASVVYVVDLLGEPKSAEEQQ